MWIGQLRAVHLIREDIVWGHRVRQRHASGELLGDRNLTPGLLAGIGAPEDDLNAIVDDSGFLQQRRKWRSGPRCIADAAVEEWQPGVAGALHRERHLLP